MRSRGILVLVGVLALAAAGWWLAILGGERADARATSRPAASDPDAAERPATLLGAPPTENSGPQEREPLPVAAAGETAAAAESAGSARLVLLVRARETGKPLEGVHVQLEQRFGAGTRSSIRMPDAAGSRVERCSCPATDADGRVELEARAGPTLTLFVNALGVIIHAGQETLTVVGLRPGERRELECTLPSIDDLRCFVRVLDDATGAPLAGARVGRTIGAPAGAGAISGPDGILLIPFASWQSARVVLQLEGYRDVELELEREYDTPDRALQVRMVRPARLVVNVRDDRGPLRGVRVAVEVQDGEPFGSDPQGWTDAAGACTFEDVTSRARLVVTARAGGGRTRSEELVLAPGEARTLAFELARGCTLLGLAQDERGEPIADLDVWRLATDGVPRQIEPAHESAVADKARTDARGRFVFESVPAGEWWIAPAPRRYGDPAFVPLATRVQIEEGESTHRLTLTVTDARSIRGRVLTSAGSPAQASVTATREGVTLRAESGASGRFVITPVAAGEWQLQASSGSYGLDGPSEKVRAVAGESDVVLRLQGGGGLNGVVLGEDGRARDPVRYPVRVPPRPWDHRDRLLGGVAGAAVTLWAEGSDSVETTDCDEQGYFRFGGQGPGTYHLVATSGANVAVLGPVRVGAAGELEWLELRLSRGAQLRLRLAGGAATLRDCRISSNGVLLVRESLAAGSELRRTLPAGPIRVELLRRTESGELAVARAVTATLGAGEETVLELEP